MGVEKFQKDAQKITISLKLAKFAGKKELIWQSFYAYTIFFVWFLVFEIWTIFIFPFVMHSWLAESWKEKLVEGCAPGPRMFYDWGP